MWPKLSLSAVDGMAKMLMWLKKSSQVKGKLQDYEADSFVALLRY